MGVLPSHRLPASWLSPPGDVPGFRLKVSSTFHHMGHELAERRGNPHTPQTLRQGLKHSSTFHYI